MVSEGDQRDEAAVTGGVGVNTRSGNKRFKYFSLLTIAIILIGTLLIFFNFVIFGILLYILATWFLIVLCRMNKSIVAKMQKMIAEKEEGNAGGA